MPGKKNMHNNGPKSKKMKVTSTILSSVDSNKCPLDYSTPQDLVTSLFINSGLSHDEFFETVWEKQFLIMKNIKEVGMLFEYFTRVVFRYFKFITLLVNCL